MTQDLSSIPIDITANKLLDWLISRRHCNKDWPEKIAVVRQKINDALQDMPQNETLAKILLEASPMNYYHCVKIVDVLKETEADSKNIFGMYGSRRMKEWQEIIKLYQKDNLNLAEGASILGRTVTYEIPALKRLSTKLEQRQAECTKQEAVSKKQAHDYREKFLHSCHQLGLKFENFDPKDSNSSFSPTENSIGRQLVTQMSQKLPEIFDNISKMAKLVQPAVIFYRKFLKATAGLTDEQLTNCCPLINIVIEKGNVTTYEWKHGEPPLKIEVPEMDYSFADEEKLDGELNLDLEVDAIDFGDITEVDGGNDSQLETREIDWGLAVDSDAAGEIDFSLDDAAEVDVSGIVLEDAGVDGGVARNDEALTILENAETRNQLLDDLFELQGFLSQRLDETKNEKNNDMMFSDDDDSIRVDNLEDLVTQVNQVLSIFNEMTTKQYLLIRESKRYITRLAESLLQNLKLAKKLDYVAEDCAIKQVQQADEIKQISPKVHLLTKQCRELQSELAKEISKKYDNRKVFITGL